MSTLHQCSVDKHTHLSWTREPQCRTQHVPSGCTCYNAPTLQTQGKWYVAALRGPHRHKHSKAHHRFLHQNQSSRTTYRCRVCSRDGPAVGSFVFLTAAVLCTTIFACTSGFVIMAFPLTTALKQRRVLVAVFSHVWLTPLRNIIIYYVFEFFFVELTLSHEAV